MEKNVHEYEFKLDKEWLDCLDKEYKEKNKEVKVDGFRKGTAPKEVFIKKFGIESLYQGAVDKAIQIGYKKLLEENKDVKPVIEPAVDIKSIDKDSITLSFKVITKPEVVLGEYKNLGLKKPECKVTKEEIEAEIKKLQDQLADQIVKENGSIADGDTAIIDFKGTVDGKVIDGGTGENYPLQIGSNTFIPGFEEKLIGHKKGETVNLDLKFPENYTEELKGKDVTFEVTINEIKTRVVPELNEDFFKDLGYDKMKTIEELREEVKKTILDEKNKQEEDKFLDECLEKAAGNMKVVINPEIVEDEENRMLEQFEHQLSHQGMDLQTYYKITNTTEEDIRKQMHPEAEKRVKYRYLIEAVADKEKLDFTKEEIDEEAKKMATEYGISVEELIKYFGSLDIVKYDMRMHKALEIIKESNLK
jgi:trigger factor